MQLAAYKLLYLPFCSLISADNRLLRDAAMPQGFGFSLQSQFEASEEAQDDKIMD